jgi:hypothetical protein
MTSDEPIDGLTEAELDARLNFVFQRADLAAFKSGQQWAAAIIGFGPWDHVQDAALRMLDVCAAPGMASDPRQNARFIDIVAGRPRTFTADEAVQFSIAMYEKLASRVKP